MGRAVCAAVCEAPDLELVVAVDPAYAALGADAARAAAEEIGAPTVSAELDALRVSAADVAVDFTNAGAARVTLPWLAEAGIHAVVGTTGLVDEDLAGVRRAFEGSRANAVLAPNFAIGAVLLLRMCEMAAPFMDGAEVIELHHDAKRDAPSGTAITTAARIAEARARAGAHAFGGDATTETVLPGARGGEASGGVRVHSVRLPGLVAHEEVVFGAAGQSLTLRHDSYDRRSFMPGVLLAVRSVAQRPGVTVGLEALLGL